MATIFIIHGFGGNPQENWFPWLKTELEKEDHTVFVPQFPNPDRPILSEWMEFFAQYKKYLDRDVILVGHSLGVAFLLNFLEKHQAKAAFFVAGVSGPLDNKFDPKMTTFSHRVFNWPSIRHHCKDFHIFHSNTDPYIPLSNAKEFANNLKSNLIVVENAGHFNAAAGYTTFPLLLEKIQEILPK